MDVYSQKKQQHQQHGQRRPLRSTSMTKIYSKRQLSSIPSCWQMMLICMAACCTLTTTSPFWCASAFTVQRPSLLSSSSSLSITRPFSGLTPRHVIVQVIRIEGDDDDEKKDDDDDEMNRAEMEEDDEDEEDNNSTDPYLQVAESEFVDKLDTQKTPLAQSLVQAGITSATPATTVDWGGALGTLRQRVQDVETGKSQDPATVLFRLMSSQTPNQAISTFVATASPSVVQAMSGAVSTLLGGLSNPLSGVETVVKATGDKVASLCFQLQMTGYLFRNAEYVMALKDLLKLPGSPSLQEYKDAFDRMDQDGSGYIEASEVEALLDDVYNGNTPQFEIQTFVKYFDTNQDGRISWDEFQKGLFGVASSLRDQKQDQLLRLLALPGAANTDGDDEDDEPDVEAHVAGKVEIVLEDGKVVQVDAQEYVAALKAEAAELKAALAREKSGALYRAAAAAAGANGSDKEDAKNSNSNSDGVGGIVGYIASRKGDIKSLTEGISPDIVKTMQMLVDYVLEGGESGKGRQQLKGKDNKPMKKEDMQMAIPGAALQQLALWQLVLGYKLREAEAKGEYLKLLE